MTDYKVQIAELILTRCAEVRSITIEECASLIEKQSTKQCNPKKLAALIRKLDQTGEL